jgi:CheY-like chemotaxis protein
MQLHALIVDDSKLARMAIAGALRRLRPDLVHVEASNAAEALDVLSKQTIHLALVDFNMPGIDGLQLMSQIRQRHPSMPVALVTANAQLEDIERARELNATFVTKPITDEAIGAFLSGAFLRLRK